MARQTLTATSEAPARERSAGPRWAEAVRARAAARFEQMAWPSKSMEEWRRTDLAPYDLDAFLDLAAADGGPAPRAGSSVLIPELRAGVARFLGTRCVEIGLRDEVASTGVELLSLEEAAGTSDVLEALFARGLEEADDRFRVWHYRSWTHGVYLRVPRDVTVKDPILLELAPDGAGGSCIPHVVVLLEQGASATVLLRYSGSSSARSLLDAVTDIKIDEGATLRLTEVQDLPEDSLAFLHTSATVAGEGKLNHLAAVLGGRLHKGRLVCSLEGQGADVSLHGLYFAAGEQHIDLLTLQRHVSPRATSRALYKGVAKDEATTVFQGLIDVAVGASKTDAYLANKNLLLSSSARADSIPSLTIRNNDLRCSHGSTTSRIDPEQRFYLMARGLPREEADEMLVEGYFEDLLTGAAATGAAGAEAAGTGAAGTEAPQTGAAGSEAAGAEALRPLVQRKLRAKG